VGRTQIARPTGRNAENRPRRHPTLCTEYFFWKSQKNGARILKTSKNHQKFLKFLKIVTIMTIIQDHFSTKMLGVTIT
jgi:hypothetical protein